MKKRFLCPNLPKLHHPVILSEEEGRHATRVMRLQDGDIVEAIDGKGNITLAQLRTRGVSPQLTWMDPELVGESVQKIIPPALNCSLVLEMAILKGACMEWTIEKAVELGISRFVPVLTDHTVVQVKSKGPEVFQQRWQKIADQALKQCGRLERMQVDLPIALSEIMSQGPLPSQAVRLWSDETAQKQAPYLLDQINSFEQAPIEIRLLIGPEGGWSQKERHNLMREPEKFQRVHLGPLILRAETAALFSTSVVAASLWKKTLETHS